MGRGIRLALAGAAVVVGVGLSLGLERAGAEDGGPGSAARVGVTLSLERRARGMEVVEAARFAARGGSASDFARRYPRSTWQARAEDVVAKSRCLLERYGIAVDDRALTRELERMQRQSQDPSALDHLFEVLDRDPVQVRECLVRPVLVDRLLRRSVAWDPELQRGARAEAARLGEADDAAELESMSGLRAHRRVYRLVEPAGFASNDDGPAGDGVDASRFGMLRSRFRSVGHVAAPVEDETALLVEAAVAVDESRIETVSVIVPKMSAEVWWREVGSGFRGLLPTRLEVTTGAVVAAAPERLSTTGAFSPERSTSDSWVLVRNVLDARAGHTAVWTGNEMIVWGGSFQERVGGIYDPATDSWTPTTSVAAPSPRSGHTAVWTGREMIIWGGVNDDIPPTGCDPYCPHDAYVRSGARYDPVLDAWRDVSLIGAPAATLGHSAVWTGREMIIWGGGESEFDSTNFGGAYDPETDRWRTTEYFQSVPSPRMYHSAVWTGREMIIWGGWRSYRTYLADGARYDPVADSWQPLETTGFLPAARYHHSAVWTGSEMIVVGGRDAHDNPLQDGSRYLPTQHRWAALPSSFWVGREAVWTGSELIAWGGADWADPGNSGARYDPSTNVWTSISLQGAPVERAAFSMLWAGDRLVVWGGRGADGELLDTGGVYRPETDAWSPTGTGGDPVTRIDHTAVWTGNEMLVWGGRASRPLADGARWEPGTGTWSALSTVGECVPRSQHTAVWDGTEMLVWGGHDDGGAFDDGCRYDPAGDSWQAMSTAGAPSPRRWHGAVWTGEEMVVWGGATWDSSGGAQERADGGLYRTADDSWQPIAGGGLPGPRAQPQLFWTGNEVIVWGGKLGGRAADAGALYRLSDHSWRLPTTDGWPNNLRNPIAVWTPRGLLTSNIGMWGDSAAGAVLYAPDADRWIRLQDLDPPSCLSGCRAVWTGHEMLVWGGQDLYQRLIAGGHRLDLVDGKWRDMTTQDGPGDRTEYTAVWTGSAMLLWGGRGGAGLAVYRPAPPPVRRAPADGRLDAR